MKSLCSALLALCTLMTTGLVSAREFTDKDLARMLVDDSWTCSDTLNVTISAKSAKYFDFNEKGIHKLANGARAIIGFECPSIRTIKFTGFTDGIKVFSGVSGVDTQWQIQTDPAPLEVMGLIFTQYTPSFATLGMVNSELEKYWEVKDITATYQYDYLEKRVQEILDPLGILESNIEAFEEYIENPSIEFKNYTDAERHYRDILQTIKRYVPDAYAAYSEALTIKGSSLKNDFWKNKVDRFIGYDKPVEEIISEISKLNAQSPGFSKYADKHLASWLREEADFIEEGLSEARLYEVSWFVEFISGLPSANSLSNFPNSQELITGRFESVASNVSSRVAELTQLAVAAINESGSNYLEVNAVMEAGFALSEEFTESGFADEAKIVLVAARDRVSRLLQQDLKVFSEAIRVEDLSIEELTAYRNQASAFADLSADFPAFSSYHQAIEDALSQRKGQICEAILDDAGVWSWEYEKTIVLDNNKKMPLTDFACLLLENQHVLTDLSWDWRPKMYSMTIKEENGAERKYALKSDAVFFYKELSFTGVKDESETAKQTQTYVTKLILQPPTGLPDKNGVRECDTLAADPNDNYKHEMVSGVDFDDENLDLDLFERAIDACIAAVEHDRSNETQQFQLARTLWYSGDQDNAKEYFLRAAQRDYPAALYFKAEILLAGSDHPNTFIDALELFQLSGDKGYAPGHAMVKELNPDGIEFFRQIPAPTEGQLFAALGEKVKSTTIFGVTTQVGATGVSIKECFQMNATDFSCEYKKKMKCGTSLSAGWGHNPLLGLMNSYMNTACNSGEYEFGGFKKLSGGGWKKIALGI